MNGGICGHAHAGVAAGWRNVARCCREVPVMCGKLTSVPRVTRGGAPVRGAPNVAVVSLESENALRYARTGQSASGESAREWAIYGRMVMDSPSTGRYPAFSLAEASDVRWRPSGYENKGEGEIRHRDRDRNWSRTEGAGHRSAHRARGRLRGMQSNWYVCCRRDVARSAARGVTTDVFVSKGN